MSQTEKTDMPGAKPGPLFEESHGANADGVAWTMERQLLRAIAWGEAPRARRLLSLGADPSARDGQGMGALARAAERGAEDLLDALIEAGASLDAVDGAGRSALMMATICGHAGCVRRLLAAGASPQAGREHPLAWSVRIGEWECFNALLEGGADVDACDESGWSCAMWAASLGRAEELEALLSRGAQAGGAALALARRFEKSRCERLLLAFEQRRELGEAAVPAKESKAAPRAL